MPSLRSSPWMRGAPPEWICDAHFPDELACFQRYRRPATMASRLPAPVQPKTRAMQPDDSLRLHNRQRIEGAWRQTIQPNKDQAIHGTESQSLWQVPSLDAKLMTKDQDLSFQRGPRLEQ